MFSQASKGENDLVPALMDNVWYRTAAQCVELCSLAKDPTCPALRRHDAGVPKVLKEARPIGMLVEEPVGPLLPSPRMTHSDPRSMRPTQPACGSVPTTRHGGQLAPCHVRLVSLLGREFLDAVYRS